MRKARSLLAGRGLQHPTRENVELSARSSEVTVMNADELGQQFFSGRYDSQPQNPDDATRSH